MLNPTVWWRDYNRDWKWSGISDESCTRSQIQGIPGQPRAITMLRQLRCLIFGSPYEGDRGRVSISSETSPDYVQSIYVPRKLVWDWRNIQWNFVVQMSGK